MVWVDRIVGEIKERFAEKIAQGKQLVLRDEKTLSGRAHLGSLRGIVIHGLIAQVLQEQGIPSVFRFELNDFDPMDEVPASLPQELREKYREYMGEPLYKVPNYGSSLVSARDDKLTMTRGAAENYPMLWGKELQDAVAPLHLPIEWYTLRPHYERGEFNEVIREALDHAAEIRAIYREVSGSVKPDDWFPLQVICEKCGKIGTTQVTHWDPAAVCHG
ncbi:hypothetical protein HY464_02725, partial [Candidatus Peregrinibacteria bacterium]|nr:hypothetical protein [Candidatus Peregrinibacteria bacterium]